MSRTGEEKRAESSPTDSDDDGRKLVAAARRGSREALNRLLDESSPPLRRYLASGMGSKLRRHVSLSDMEQNVLLVGADLLQLLPEGASMGDFQALLCNKARWTIVNVARKHKNIHGESSVREGVLRLPGGRGQESDGEVTDRDQHDWLVAGLENLNEELRAIVQMRLDDLGFEEIAESLGISSRTARRRYLQAARLLRGTPDGERPD